MPVTDGVVLPLSPPEAFAAGTFNKVPVLVGNNAKEFYLFAAREETRNTGPALDWSGLSKRIEHMPFGGTNVRASDVLANYPQSQFANAVSALATIEGDALFACTTDLTAKALSATVPTYGYEIDIRNGYQQQTLALGNHLLPAGVSYHTTDLAYVFNNRNDASPLSGRDLQLAQMIQGYWARFAASGDPNDRAGAAGPTWPVYRLDGPALLKISDQSVPETDFARTHHCGLWNNSR
jgi:para-nitrobenzyl esterase